MKKILLFILFFIVYSPSFSQDAATIYKMTVNSTVTIETEDGLGSGFFVAENIIATNYHVIKGSSLAFCRTNNSPTKYQIIGYVAINMAVDLVLLQVAGLNRPAIKIATTQVVPGQHVFVIGSPKGLEASISDGIVSGLRDFDGYKLIQITAPISPGSSGGPVLNTNGELVGISVLQYVEGQNLNFAIPKSGLEELLIFRKGYSSPLADLLPQVKPKSNESYQVSNYGLSLIEAKQNIDNLLASANGSSQSKNFLFKMKIYGAIAKEKSLYNKYPKANVEAFEALKKYLELDPRENQIKADKYDGVNGIYNTFFDKGVEFYKTQNWQEAYYEFQQMAAMGDLLIARKWSTSPFDTTSYLYAAATAQNAKLEPEAVQYYSKLADIKVSGKDYEGVYEYLTKYYLNNPNDEQFKKYIGLAKEVYPTNNLWKDIEFEYTKKNTNLASFVSKFDAEDAANTLTSEAYFDYGNYFANDEKIKDLPEDQRAQYNKKAQYAFEKAYQKDTTNGIAAYNAGVTAYTNWETVAQAARDIKGITADVKVKKTVANKQAFEAADQSIAWLEKAHRSLLGKAHRSNLEKGLLNKSVDLLYNVFEYKRDMSRGINPKDYDAYDAKLNYYNGLHAKY